MNNPPIIDIEILIGFFRFHPALEAEGLYCLRTLTCSYSAGSWLHANRYIQKRIQELNLAHGGKVEELDRRTAISKLPWSTDPGYTPLFNATPSNVPSRLLGPIIVPARSGIDCSEQSKADRIFPMGENADTYPGMP